MSDNSLMLEILKSLQSGQTDIKADLSDIKQRLNRIELSIGSMKKEDAELYIADVSQSARIDRLADKLERIERRLDIRE